MEGDVELEETNRHHELVEEAKEEQNEQPIPGGQPQEDRKHCDWIGWIIRIAIVLVILGIAIWAIVDKDRLTAVFKSFIDWMRDNPVLAPFVLIVVYIIATVLFIPGIILTLGAGFAFNQAYNNVGLAIFVGSVSVWIGAMFGSILAMFVGRYVLRNWVSRQTKRFKIFGAIDKAIETEGFKLTFLLRLSPLIPYNLFNYLMGITKVSLTKYTLGGLGMIPGVIVYVYFGTAISNLSDAASGSFDGGVLQLVLLIVGSVLAFLAVLYVSWVARREIKKVLAKNDEQNQSNEQPDEVNQPQSEERADEQNVAEDIQSQERHASSENFNANAERIRDDVE
uniref:VTT domain-containing protein n=2 Tax=Euplotes harpa TaxID=151035 RepID=A0A7S3J780_9SPIT|mmetsp:Transcript_20620/g.23850  ORF Transcript_20620/g.23850 Transcript_20620/m.23850 type:complete len:338 (+) Transcript_20620:26-1039(+)